MCFVSASSSSYNTCTCDGMYALLCSGEEGEVSNKKQLIETARLIAKTSEEVVKMAKKVADACTDKRMKRVSAPTCNVLWIVLLYIHVHGRT